MPALEGDDDQHSRAKRRSKRTVITLEYPKHLLNPEDVLDFIETKQFEKRWEKLGLNDEDDLFTLQMFIASGPKSAPVIAGTDGIRKGRYSPPGRNTGTSGALRILYVHFEEFGFVLLLLVYEKNEIDNISDAVKKHLNKLVKEAESELRLRWTLRVK